MSIATVIAATLTLLAKIFIDKYFPKENISREANIVSLTLLFTYSIYMFCIVLGVKLGNSIDLIQLNLVFFLIYLLFTLLAFAFYAHSLKKEFRIKQREAEFLTMQNYTENLEKQYSQMRKFRHDYQNILASLDGYIDDQDFVGLTNYYKNNIRKASKFISENNFKLDDFSRVHVKEIKSLLAAKILYAQEIGIDASFECSEDIFKINLDSVVLIRVLGIFLDNAIEELEELKNGYLRVAIIDYSSGVQIIIENTCREDIEPLHKLEKSGYSSKGLNRGLGLSNVEEILKDIESVILETAINNKRFTQILYIENDNKE